MTTYLLVRVRRFVSLAIFGVAFLTFAPVAQAQTVWINEIHYEDAGTDGNEFVEIAGTAGTSLTGWTIELYNGANGLRYDSDALSGSIPNQSNGFGTVALSYPIDGIQNGAPDGVALVNNGTVVQFLCYEGTFTAANSTANGMTCSAISTSESSSTTDGTSMQLQGTGDEYSDFTWAAGLTATSGAINTGQTFPTPLPTLSISDPAPQVEGNGGTVTYQFTVTLSAPAGAGGVTFDIATADDTATTADNDYVAKSLTNQPIGAGDDTYVFEVTVNGDTTPEPDETFLVNVSNVTGATVSDGEGQGYITNDDASITISDPTQSEGNAGDNPTITFVVTVDNPDANGIVEFDVATADNTATTSNNDYQASSVINQQIMGSGTFNFVVTLNGDNAVEPAETFFANLTNVTGATVLDAQGQGTIENDDSPNLSVDDPSVTEGNAGSSTLTFTVSLSAIADSPVSFTYTTADGTAQDDIPGTDDEDYQASSGAGQIDAGELSTTVTITVNGDTEIEPDETVLLNLDNVEGANPTDTQGEGTILNDDIGLSIEDVTKAEGNSGTTTFNFVVTLAQAPGTGTVTFDIATSDGTATDADNDYEPRSVTAVSLTGTQTTYAFDVTVNGDTKLEADQAFTVTVSNINGAIGTDTEATGTIQNDDNAPTISINDVEVVETHAGTTLATFTVSLSNASDSEIGVTYATVADSATEASDYTAAGGTLTFASGETSKPVQVSVLGDMVAEGNEQFFVDLSLPTGGATISDARGLGVIEMDDPFSIAAVNVAYTENFDVLSSDDASNARAATTPVAWNFAEADTNANITYRPSNGSTNGASSGSGDTYSLGTTSSSDRAFGGLASGSLDPSVVGAYFRNDTGQTITTLSISYTGEEWRLGDTTTADRLWFEYSTTATTLQTGTTGWTAVSQLDFISPNQTGAGVKDGNDAANRSAVGYTISGLSIAPGSTFWIRWSNRDESGSDDALGVDDFSIIANVEGGVLTIDDVLVTEGDGAGTVNAVFTVSLSEPAGEGGVSFDIATADNTATTANNDYVANSVTGVSIPQGSTSYQFTVVVNSDDTVESTETFYVNVTNVGGATLNDGQGLGTIASDDFNFTPIHSVQGSGQQSPMIGTTVTVDGIVTGIKTGSSGGFFVQAPEADYDTFDTTSEGIFVFTGSSVPAGVVIGNRVAVTGTVTEFPSSATPHTVTELSGTVTVDLQAEDQTLPDPTPITVADGQPTSNLSQYEKYEGMRVSATLTVVAPTDGSVDENDALGGSNGVFYGVIQGVDRPFREPGIEQSLSVPSDAACAACIDRFDENPEKIRVDSDNQPGATQLNVTAGQTVSNLVGPLDYGFFEYTLLPEAATVPEVTGDSTYDAVPIPLATELTISSFNLERFYDTVDDAGVSDVALTPTAFANRLNKASLAIREVLMTPDVIGIVEVENLSTLQSLATKVNADTGGATNYAAYLEEGNDIGGIDVGFLVDLNRVTVNSVTQFGKTATFTNPDTSAQETLNDRPPLVLEASIPRTDATPYEFTVIVNHLRSLNGVETDDASGRRVRAKRAAQAEYLADLVQDRQVADPYERIILVGDFNAFEFNDGYVDVIGTIKGTPAPATEVVDPTSDLVNPNLTNLIETLEPDERYTYVFDGSAQVLDHSIVNAAMLPSLTRFAIGHLDADFPEIFRSDATRPERISDHDAPVAYFDLSPLPRVSIGDGSATEGNSGTTSMSFEVTLSASSSQTVTVNYATSNNTATAGVDYTGESGTVTFAPGDMAETITIDVTGDTLFEGNETFTVTLSNVSITAMINDGTATGTIQDDDTASGMSILDSSADENSGTMTFTVNLAAPVSEEVTVNYATSNGTAIAGTDYVAESGTITFAPNDQSETIVIDLIGDTLFEADETFTVTLSDASSTTTISDGTATGTILNDDTPSGMYILDNSANESSGTITFTVNLANPVSEEVTVDYATSNGTAIAGSDYVAKSGTLTFAPNDQSETITITLLDDTAYELDESFTVTLSNASGTTSVSDGTATGTILNDDTALADLTLTMEMSPENPQHGDNITFTIVVTNNGPDSATGVTVTDDLPDGLDFVSAETTQGSCTTEDPVVCTVGTLTDGQSVTITIVAVATLNQGSVINTASADSNEVDATGASDTELIVISPSSHANVPTLSEWMLMLLAAMLAMVALAKTRS